MKTVLLPWVAIIVFAFISVQPADAGEKFLKAHSKSLFTTPSGFKKEAMDGLDAKCAEQKGKIFHTDCYSTGQGEWCSGICKFGEDLDRANKGASCETQLSASRAQLALISQSAPGVTGGQRKELIQVISQIDSFLKGSTAPLGK